LGKTALRAGALAPGGIYATGDQRRLRFVYVCVRC